MLSHNKLENGDMRSLVCLHDLVMHTLVLLIMRGLDFATPNSIRSSWQLCINISKSNVIFSQGVFKQSGTSWLLIAKVFSKSGLCAYKIMFIFASNMTVINTIEGFVWLGK